MIVAIQQPEHLPWLGFFDKMLRCDSYVILENVQFKKRYFENRNKICTKEGWQWITVPVVTKGRYTQKINEVMIDNSLNWQRKYLGSIQTSYGKACYFNKFFPLLKEIIESDHQFLSTLNIELINLLKDYFRIDTPCFIASELVTSEFRGSDLILQLCLKTGADTYLSGPDGKNYLNLDQFQKYGIKVTYHNYAHPEYSQFHNSEFIPYMSAVDYIFNHGNRLI
jgi:hypothetical protein